MSQVDHYAVLGVLPDAEPVVILAAYRALASLYHPDRWSGDKDQANRRMAEINVAYGVLSDPDKHKDYDRSRVASTSSIDDDADSADEAADQALVELASRWQTAISILPDLEVISTRLSKIAHRLAFAYVVTMLETRAFQKREQIASAMELKFLVAHFGPSPEIHAFARRLVDLGHRDAIRALNRYIDVMGSGVDPSILIRKVIEEFEVSKWESRHQKESPEAVSKIQTLQHEAGKNGAFWAVKDLTREMGYTLDEVSPGFLKPHEYTLHAPSKQPGRRGELILDTVSATDLSDWVRLHLC